MTHITRSGAGSTYGTPEQKLKFIRYLRDNQRFTLEELAQKSLYSVETVKAWFSDNPQRYRVCQDRAVAMLLAQLDLDVADYWVIVNA